MVNMGHNAKIAVALNGDFGNATLELARVRLGSKMPAQGGQQRPCVGTPPQWAAAPNPIALGEESLSGEPS